MAQGGCLTGGARKPRATISSYLLEARDRRSVIPLARALALVVREQRSLECAYGLHCLIRHRSSSVAPNPSRRALGLRVGSILRAWVEAPHFPTKRDLVRSAP